MIELKTLKDIFDFQIQEGRQTGRTSLSIQKAYLYSELKAEAVKWVKELVLHYDFASSHAKIMWIREFFNLTEEDLQ